MIFMLAVGITGLLLTWKSELGLKPPTQKANFNEPTMHLLAIEDIAKRYADSLGLNTTINRIDFRPTKGIAKVRFEHHFTEIHINAHYGKVVSVNHRTSDLIEMIHDGSIVDFLFKSDSENAKLIYSTITSLGLIFLAISGFLMWRKPRQIKKLKQKNS